MSKGRTDRETRHDNKATSVPLKSKGRTDRKTRQDNKTTSVPLKSKGQKLVLKRSILGLDRVLNRDEARAPAQIKRCLRYGGGREGEGQPDSQPDTERQTDTERHTDRETDSQTEKETGRQIHN